jgi:hypothetical protein
LGKKDVEEALKRLENLIQEEVLMAIAETMKASIEHKDGAQPLRPATYITLNHCPLRCQESK